jgi:hypothetical protein
MGVRVAECVSRDAKPEVITLRRNLKTCTEKEVSQVYFKSASTTRLCIQILNLVVAGIYNSLPFLHFILHASAVVGFMAPINKACRGTCSV